MMGLGYVQKLIYSFEDVSKLVKIVDTLITPQFKIYYEQKIIEYSIDRKQWVRLNDLIYQIQIKFIRFHFGQLLDLFEKLLNYVEELKQKNIDHLYLDSNRIWLVLRPESEYPNIIYSKLIYDIAFTGYQCPFYENPSIQAQEGSIKMQQIILEIVQSFLNIQVGLIKNEELNCQEKQIFEDLKKILTIGSIQNSLQFIKQQKQQHKYNESTKKLSFDEETSFLSCRKLRVNDVFEAFQQNLQQLELQDQLTYEEFFQTITKIFASSLDTIGIYKAPKFKVKLLIATAKTRLKSEKDQLCAQMKEPINCLLNQKVQQSSALYKFEFTEQELSEMENEIFEALVNQRINQYFNNSYFFNRIRTFMI